MEPVLLDKSVQPDDKILKNVLGSSFKLYSEFRKKLDKEYKGLKIEWKYYGKKSGWTMKCFYKSRNLFFFTPYENQIRIAFLFGEKAVKVIQGSDLRKELIEELANSKRYVEGRVLRIEIRSKENIDEIMKLILIKIEN